MDPAGSFQHSLTIQTVQYFSGEVKHPLEAEWSTPRQIQELPPARALHHILPVSAASPPPHWAGACFHLRQIHFRALALQKFHFCLPEAQLFFVSAFFPSQASSLQG